MANIVNYDLKELQTFLEGRLTRKRFQHSLNVAAEAKKLAENYGANNIDTEKAYFAGLMHDCCKELPSNELKNLAFSANLNMDKTEINAKSLWHGIAGASFVRDNLHISDSEIINAIRFHTVGRAGMSLLEEIVYIADMISEDRTFDGVDKLRKMAYQDLKITMFECIKYSLNKVINKNGFISNYTFASYNYYLSLFGENFYNKKA
ncbi:HD domain-containing protein [Clostridia bacterium]|nr:HD domain-containing protein [Clostridia bacterium]